MLFTLPALFNISIKPDRYIAPIYELITLRFTLMPKSLIMNFGYLYNICNIVYLINQYIYSNIYLRQCTGLSTRRINKCLFLVK